MTFPASVAGPAGATPLTLLLLALLAGALLALVSCAAPGSRPAAPDPAGKDDSGSAAGPTVRVALFNVRELSAGKLAEVDTAGIGSHPQLRAAAEIVQRVRPDVLVVQEIDFPFDAADPATHARAFARRYLATGDRPLEYPHVFAAPVNTGLLSGFDLDGDGRVATAADLGERAYGDDSLGWGTYPGQYGMAVLSRHPLAAADVRTFRRFPWRDLPGHHLPPGFYSEDELAVLPLSSKSHWDLPVVVDGAGDGGPVRLHLWVSHPTPPVFDGPEDRNGRRNFDEIMLWRQYLDGEPALVDDDGRAGGYAAGAPFVIVGDLNAAEGGDEVVYDGVRAIDQLLLHTAIQDPGELLVSAGAPADTPRATTEFGGAGRRVDYVLPSRGLEVLAGGVYWPDPATDPQGNADARLASDHRLVWLDLRIPAE